MNTSILSGRLTRDPEVRQANVGKASVSVCTFTLAVQRPYKDANGERPVDFIDCVAWRGLADFIGKYFSKGTKLIVSKGSIQTRNWEDKEGHKRKSTEVVVEEVEFGESAPQKTTTTQQKPAATAPAAPAATRSTGAPPPAPAPGYDPALDKEETFKGEEDLESMYPFDL